MSIKFASRFSYEEEQYHIPLFPIELTVSYCIFNLLFQAIEDSLGSLNLSYGGVADKQAGKYSGGMKRRLSVAISLIGDPKVFLSNLNSFYFLM